MTRPGRRGRIGVIQPAPGVMIEHEWPQWLPTGILFPVGRVRLNGGTAEDFAEFAAAAPDAARDLASAGADLIAFACTLGSLYSGLDGENRLASALAETAGKTALTLGAACTNALRKVGARSLAIMTPYGEAANFWVKEYAMSQGFAVAGVITTPAGIATIGDMSTDEIATLAVKCVRSLPAADALWLPCTALQTIGAIAAIEEMTGKPVISGSQALLWQSLATLGIGDAISGAGRLFD